MTNGMKKLTWWRTTESDSRSWLTQPPFPNWFYLQFNRISGNGNLKGRQQMQSVAIRNSGETRKHSFLLQSFIYRAYENGFVYLIWEIKFFNEYFFFSNSQWAYFPNIHCDHLFIMHNYLTWCTWKISQCYYRQSPKLF